MVLTSTGSRFRSGIEIKTAGVSSATPAVYACDLNNNGTYNEAADGQNIACNFMAWDDLTAYLDWAALRPMSELEFEKACRGTATAVANEYAWGTTSITCAAGVSNSGSTSEIASTAAPNCVCDNSVAAHAIPGATDGGPTGGPLRTGNFADASSTRASSGASALGAMDLSGNLWERTVAVGSTTGRAFTGVNGDGVLTAAGDANGSNWPGTSAAGTGFRGGSCNRSLVAQRVSDRQYADFDYTPRYQDYGGRGVRTAP